MLDWKFNKDESYAYCSGTTWDGEKFSADVVMREFDWHWSVQSDSWAHRLTMDGGLGICDTREEAQKEAEDYLRKCGDIR